MAVPSTVRDLILQEEGFKNEVYPDADGFSAGYGHFLSDEELKRYPPGTIVPQAQLDEWFEADLQKAYDSASQQNSQLGTPVDIARLTSVNYQLGSGWNQDFDKTWGLMQAGDFAGASKEVLDSDWANWQTPDRANKFSSALASMAMAQPAPASPTPAQPSPIQITPTQAAPAQSPIMSLMPGGRGSLPEGIPSPAFMGPGSSAQEDLTRTLMGGLGAQQQDLLPEGWRPPPTTLGGVFTTSMEAGASQLVGDAHTFGAIFNLLSGNDEGAERKLNRARQHAEYSGALLSSVGEFKDFLDAPTFPGFMRQVTRAIGQFTPMALSSIASGLTGAAVGAAGRGILSAASQRYSRKLLTDLVKKHARGEALAPDEKAILNSAYETLHRVNKFSLQGKYSVYADIIKTGHNYQNMPFISGGFWAGAFGQEYEDAGYQLTAEEARTALALGIPQAVIGTLGERLFAGAIFKRVGRGVNQARRKSGIPINQLSKRVGELPDDAKSAVRYMREIGKGFGEGLVVGGLQEGITETAQEELFIRQRMAIDPEYSQEEANLRRAESAFAGFWAGGGRSAIATPAANVIREARRQVNDGRNIRDDVRNAERVGRTSQIEPTAWGVAQTQALLNPGTSTGSVWLPTEGMTDSQIDAYSEGYIKTIEDTLGKEAADSLSIERDLEGRGILVLDKTKDDLIQQADRNAFREFGPTEENLKNLLGYTEVTKPEHDLVVAVRDKAGNVVWYQTIDDAGRDTAEARAAQRFPDRESFPIEVMGREEFAELKNGLHEDLRKTGTAARGALKGAWEEALKKILAGSSFAASTDATSPREDDATIRGMTEDVQDSQEAIEASLLRDAEGNFTTTVNRAGYVVTPLSKKQQQEMTEEELAEYYLGDRDNRSIQEFASGVDEIVPAKLTPKERLNRAQRRIRNELLYLKYNGITPPADLNVADLDAVDNWLTSTINSQLEGPSRSLRDILDEFSVPFLSAFAKAIQPYVLENPETGELDKGTVEFVAERTTLENGKAGWRIKMEGGGRVDIPGRLPNIVAKSIAHALARTDSAEIVEENPDGTRITALQKAQREGTPGWYIKKPGEEKLNPVYMGPLVHFGRQVLIRNEIAKVESDAQLTLDAFTRLTEILDEYDYQLLFAPTRGAEPQPLFTSPQEVEGPVTEPVTGPAGEAAEFFRRGRPKGISPEQPTRLPGIFQRLDTGSRPGYIFNENLAGERVVPVEQPAAAQPAAAQPAATINIFAGTNENAELSNFAIRPFEYEDRQYHSVEHAYQSLKSGQFDGTVYNNSGWGKRAAKVATGRKGTKTDKTNNIYGSWNYQLMRDLMGASFLANPEARQALLDTGNAVLTHTQARTVWRTKFPELLMDVRAEYDADPSLQPSWVAYNEEMIDLYAKQQYELEKAEAAQPAAVEPTVVETVPRLSVPLLRNNPDKVYLFGDNLRGWGKKGQAVIRDEPNAVGIPTKKAPSMASNAFFTDAEYEANVKAIDEAFANIPAGRTVVLPEAGLGTGLARLEQTAPRTFAYLNEKIAALEAAAVQPTAAQPVTQPAFRDAPIYKFRGKSQATVRRTSPSKASEKALYRDNVNITLNELTEITQEETRTRDKRNQRMPEDLRGLEPGVLRKELAVLEGREKEIREGIREEVRREVEEEMFPVDEEGNRKWLNRSDFMKLQNKIKEEVAFRNSQVTKALRGDLLKSLESLPSLGFDRQSFIEARDQADIVFETKSPVHRGGIESSRGRVGQHRWARRDPRTGVIHINEKILKQKFKDKAWTKPPVEGVRPLPEDAFSTLAGFREFIILHEVGHGLVNRVEGAPVYPNEFNESYGAHENRINDGALIIARSTQQQDFAQPTDEGWSPYSNKDIGALLDERSAYMERLQLLRRSPISAVAEYVPDFTEEVKGIDEDMFGEEIRDIDRQAAPGVLARKTYEPDYGEYARVRDYSRASQTVQGPARTAVAEFPAQPTLGDPSRRSNVDFVSPRIELDSAIAELWTGLPKLLEKHFKYSKERLRIITLETAKEYHANGRADPSFPENSSAVLGGVIDALDRQQGALAKFIKFKNADVIIIKVPGGVIDGTFVEAPTPAEQVKLMYTLGHELGHALFQQELKRSLASPVVRKRLIEAWKRAKKRSGEYQKGQELFLEEGEYSIGFEEWYADQVSIWLFNEHKKATNATDSIFKRLAARIRDIFKSLSKEFRNRFGDQYQGVAFSNYINATVAAYKEGIDPASMSYDELVVVRDMIDNVISVKAAEGGWTKNVVRKLKKNVLDWLSDNKDVIPTDRKHWGVKFFLTTAHNFLVRGSFHEQSKISAKALAAFLYSPSQTTDKPGHLNSKPGVVARWRNKLFELAPTKTNALGKQVPDLEAFAGILTEAERNVPKERLSPEARKVREFLDTFYKEVITNIDSTILKRENFFPRMLAIHELQQNPEAREKLVKLLERENPNAVFPGGGKVDFNKVVEKLISENEQNLDNPVDDDGANTDGIGDISLGTSRRRTEYFTNITNEQLREIGVLENPLVVIDKYVGDMTKRMDYDQHAQTVVTAEDMARAQLHNEQGNSLKFLLGENVGEGSIVKGWKAAEVLLQRIEDPSDRAAIRSTYSAMIGKTGLKISPMARQVNSLFLTINIVSYLTFATLASLPDLAGPILRSKDFTALGVWFHQWKHYFNNREEMQQFGRDVGVISFDSLSTSLMNSQEMGYMTPAFQRGSDLFFRSIGLEAFTNFTRVFALGMGEQFLVRTAQRASDASLTQVERDRAARHLAELQVSKEDVAHWSDNQRQGTKFRTFEDEQGERVRQALFTFVEESIVRPNAAERPVWASNPYTALIWQLKSFFYAYGKNIVGGAWREGVNRYSEDGTITSASMPLAIGALTLLPLTVIGLEIREWLKFLARGGDASAFRTDSMPWGEYTMEIIDRSGALGAPGLVLPMLEADEFGGEWWVPPLGPTAERFEDLIKGDFKVKDVLPWVGSI